MNRAINKAIKDATGFDVKVHKSDGCCHFYSEDAKTQDILSSFYSTTVYINTINSYTVKQWVDEFKFLISKESKIN